MPLGGDNLSRYYSRIFFKAAVMLNKKTKTCVMAVEILKLTAVTMTSV